MPFSGQFGTPNSMLGNIIFGYGSQMAPGQTALAGVALTDIGFKYDCALGYDPGTGQALMYGYMIADGQKWEEGTQLQDTQKLIQAASAAATDRDFTYWPKVSQGDWSGGLGQLVYTTPNRFYQSNGLDTSKPGYLTLQNAVGQSGHTTYALTGTYNTLPLVSDGFNWYLGLSQTGKNLLIGNSSGITSYSVAGGEILDMLYTPAGVVYGTASGIWLVTSAGVASAVSVDGISQLPRQSFAYFDELLFYIKAPGTSIYSVNLTTGGSLVQLVATSANQWEPHFTCLASISSGLFYSKGTFGNGPGNGANILYTNSGTTETRIDQIQGVVKQAWEANGTTYILAQLDQLASTAADYTLYTLTSSVITGAVLAILNDNRWAPPDFLASNPSPTSTCRGSIDADGRFVYFAWPGQPAFRYDLVSQGISQVSPPGNVINNAGGYGINSLCSHRVLNVSGLGYVHVVGSGTTASVNVCASPPTTGTIVTSFYDFTTPTIAKNFRGFEIDLFAPMPGGAGITVSFGLDTSTTFTPAVVQQTAPTVINCIVPPNLRANRIRYQVTLTANATGLAPVITSWSTKASLGRVWRTTLSCKRNQQLRNGQNDDQAAQPQDLIANVYKAYQNAGKAIMMIPSPSIQPPPTVQGQPTTAGYAETVRVSLEEYTWAAVVPGARSTEQMPVLQEGDIQITATEIVA